MTECNLLRFSVASPVIYPPPRCRHRKCDIRAAPPLPWRDLEQLEGVQPLLVVIQIKRYCIVNKNLLLWNWERSPFLKFGSRTFLLHNKNRAQFKQGVPSRLQEFFLFLEFGRQPLCFFLILARTLGCKDAKETGDYWSKTHSEFKK